jgi:protocatechuate 3,4-dioxygenase beta subunit
MTKPFTLDRRRALSLVAVTAIGGALLNQKAFAAEAGASSADAAALIPGADVCVITPEVTEGPYYFDPKLERAEITEGHPGVPAAIRLQVVDGACKPIAKARVDIWHCDASGLYSGYAGQGDDGQTTTEGKTFLRGTQFTAETGTVEFASIYPGWYRGRTTHIHFKVFLDQTNVLTGQIFFPDALSQFIYERVPPYNARKTARDTLNTSDGIASQATRGSFAYVKELADKYLVAMIIGVDPKAVSAGGGPRGPGGPPPGGPGGPGGGGDKGSLVPGVDGIS